MFSFLLEVLDYLYDSLQVEVYLGVLVQVFYLRLGLMIRCLLDFENFLDLIKGVLGHELHLVLLLIAGVFYGFCLNHIFGFLLRTLLAQVEGTLELDERLPSLQLEVLHTLVLMLREESQIIDLLLSVQELQLELFDSIGESKDLVGVVHLSLHCLFFQYFSLLEVLQPMIHLEEILKEDFPQKEKDFREMGKLLHFLQLDGLGFHALLNGVGDFLQNGGQVRLELLLSDKVILSDDGLQLVFGVPVGLLDFVQQESVELKQQERLLDGLQLGEVVVLLEVLVNY